MQCRRRPGVDHRIAFCIGRSFICLRSRIRAVSARITKAGTRKTNSSCKSANPPVAMLSYHAKPIFHGLHISNNNETQLRKRATASWQYGKSIYIQKAPTVGSGPMGAVEARFELAEGVALTRFRGVLLRPLGHSTMVVARHCRTTTFLLCHRVPTWQAAWRSRPSLWTQP